MKKKNAKISYEYSTEVVYCQANGYAEKIGMQKWYLALQQPKKKLP